MLPAWSTSIAPARRSTAISSCWCRTRRISCRRPKDWFPPPVALGSALGVVLLIGFFLWSRERRVRKQRERLRKTYKLGEEILARHVGRVHSEAPAGGAARHHERHRRARSMFTTARAETLDSVAAEGEAPVSIPLVAPRRRTISGRGLVFSIPHSAGDSGPRAQPFHRAAGQRSCSQIAAVRRRCWRRARWRVSSNSTVHDRARDLHRRRAGAGAAPGQPGRRRDPAAGTAVRAGAALPHRKAGRGRPADFGRRERTAGAAGIHRGAGARALDTARGPARRSASFRAIAARSAEGVGHCGAPGFVCRGRTGRSAPGARSARCCAS